MISVIIPVLNEANTVSQAMETLLRQSADYEVIVVDGGSNDDTRDIVRSFPVLLVEKSAKIPVGIGCQLNLGAAKAQGDVLLFLHVDVQLPDGALRMIDAALASGHYVGGGFLAKYDADHILLRLSGWRMRTRARLQKLFPGDTAPFVRREIFQSVGGYQELAIMDDYEFAERLRGAGPLAIIEAAVTISARRHLSRGILRSMVTTEITKWLYWCGVSPNRLASFYRGRRRISQDTCERT